MSSQEHSSEPAPPPGYGRQAWGSTAEVIEPNPVPPAGKSGASPALERLSAHSHCLLWEARIWEEGGQLHWEFMPSHLEAAQRFLPLEVDGLSQWGAAWLQSQTLAGAVEPRTLVERLLAPDRRSPRDFPCRDREGQVRWLRESAEVEAIAPGHWRATGLCTEVTDLKGSVEALLRSHSGYQRMFHANPQPMWVYDSETLTILAVNAAALRQYGYTEAEFLGLTLWELRPPEAVPALQAALQQGLPELRPPGHFVHQRKDGSRLDVEITSYAITFEGRSARLVLALDVTARLRAEAALRENEHRMEAILSSLDEVVWSVSADQKTLLYLNAAGERLFGVPVSTFYQSPSRWREHVHPDDRQLMEEAERSFLATGTFLATYRIIRADGAVRRVRTRAKMALDNHGQPVRVDAIMEDITEQEELEQQLRHSQKMEAIGRLAGGVAHDFNNMLSVINGYTELLLGRTAPSAWERQPLEQIAKAGERAAQLTRQLLAFGRRQLVAPQVLDVNHLLCGMLGMLQPLIGEDIEIGTAFAADTCPVRMDAGQLEQVVMNLAVNARDAMPGGGTLLLRSRNRLLPGSPDAPAPRTDHDGTTWVVLDVADSGCGMDAATLERIWEPFFTTKEVGRGTGLGLATVYGIVHQAGGFVEVQSVPGQGSTFSVHLPAVPDCCPPPDAPPPLAP